MPRDAVRRHPVIKVEWAPGLVDNGDVLGVQVCLARNGRIAHCRVVEHAIVIFEELSLRGCVAALDGSDVIRASGIGTPERARELGLSLAAELFDLGARDVLDQRTVERE